MKTSEIRPAGEIESLEPGLYAGVDDATYFGIDAASNSRLSQLLKSPRHCHESINGTFEDTPALRFGSQAHTAVLQPTLFAKDYAVFKGDLRSKDQKAIYEDLTTRLGERNVVREKEYEQILAMVAAVHGHRIAKVVLSLPGPSELVALWRDEGTGLLCKAKIDRYCEEKMVLIDYKTTRSAQPDDFSRSMATFGYHRQGAWYLRGMRALGVPLQDFVLVAQEKTAPYMVAVYRIAGSEIMTGDVEVERLLNIYADCRDTGRWPGYTEEAIMDMMLPSWYHSQTPLTDVYED